MEMLIKKIAKSKQPWLIQFNNNKKEKICWTNQQINTSMFSITPKSPSTPNTHNLSFLESEQTQFTHIEKEQ